MITPIGVQMEYDRERVSAFYSRYTSYGLCDACDSCTLGLVSRKV